MRHGLFRRPRSAATTSLCAAYGNSSASLSTTRRIAAQKQRESTSNSMAGGSPGISFLDAMKAVHAMSTVALRQNSKSTTAASPATDETCRINRPFVVHVGDHNSMNASLDSPGSDVNVQQSSYLRLSAQQRRDRTAARTLTDMDVASSSQCVNRAMFSGVVERVECGYWYDQPVLQLRMGMGAEEETLAVRCPFTSFVGCVLQSVIRNPADLDDSQKSVLAAAMTDTGKSSRADNLGQRSVAPPMSDRENGLGGDAAEELRIAPEIVESTFGFGVGTQAPSTGPLNNQTDVDAPAFMESVRSVAESAYVGCHVIVTGRLVMEETYVPEAFRSVKLPFLVLPCDGIASAIHITKYPEGTK